MRINGVIKTIVNALKSKKINPVKDFASTIWMSLIDLLLFRMDGCSIQHQA
jgi:hypothetical protein